jgi:hypothetical protein
MSELATRHLTEMQEAFVERLIECGDASTAARLAGFADRREPWRLLRIPHVLAAVNAAMKTALAHDAPVARLLLRQYVMDPKMNPKIRLEAAKTLLDRSGYVAPKARDDSADGGYRSLHEMTTEQLRAEADRLAGEIANRATPVLGASEAPIETEDGSID